MKNIKISMVMIFALLLSVGSFAQRGRGHDNHYNPGNHYNNQRSHVSINVGPRYNYRPGYSYRPVYRPSYRPYYSYPQVYRPAYRPVYRRPAYVHYGPVFGLRINVLPYGYNRINVGSNPYYYNDGVYYRNYNNGGYEVVAPPLNATVSKLPSNATVTVIDGQKYYQVGGTFYQEEIAENNLLSYRVVGTDGVIDTQNANVDENLNAYDQEIPAIGSRYDELPAESKVQVINQQKYFISTGGIYYKEVIEGDKIRYEVTTVE
ncbi:MAG: DUF6515 family protein [Ferruginibacter sp.]